MEGTSWLAVSEGEKEVTAEQERGLGLEGFWWDWRVHLRDLDVGLGWRL